MQAITVLAVLSLITAGVANARIAAQGVRKLDIETAAPSPVVLAPTDCEDVWISSLSRFWAMETYAGQNQGPCTRYAGRGAIFFHHVGQWRVVSHGFTDGCPQPHQIPGVPYSIALDLLSCRAPAPAPILAGPWATGQRGYGQTRPTTIFNGGDPSGLVNQIRWSSWGKTQAVGFGIGLWVGPHQATLQGRREPAKVVLFLLGSCRGRRAYNAIEWYFPQHGQRFDPGNYINACTGTYYLNGHPQP